LYFQKKIAYCMGVNRKIEVFMRIISGEWRGRKLLRPSADVTRPTTDRVREALFSILMSKIGRFEDLIVFDAFAGSGALGLEALSRGAGHVVFAEKNSQVKQVLQENIFSLGVVDDSTVINDAFYDTTVGKIFDLVFMDPPYGAGLEYKLMPFLCAKGMIHEETVIVLETQSDSVPETIDSFSKFDVRVYGSCSLSFWRLS
jgi:16S rRNA (guanine966-N2)-methyltransferase